MDKGKDRVRAILDSFLGSRLLLPLSALTFLFVIAVAFGLVYQNARLMHDQINEDFNEQQLILARQAASQIDAALEDLAVEIQTLKSMRSDNPSTPLDEAMRAMVERTRGKGLIEVGLFDPSRRLIQIFDGGREYPTSAADLGQGCHFEEAGPSRLGPLKIEHSSEGQSVVTSLLCSTIDFPSGERGTIFAKIEVSRLAANVTQDIQSGRTGYAWAIDQTGMFLAHPEREFIGKDAFTARKERKPYIRFTQINAIMKDRMLRGEEGTSVYVSGWHRGIEGEIHKLMAFRPVSSRVLGPGQVWSVAVVAPISEVAETVRMIYTRHFAAEALLIAAVFVFGLLVAIYQQRMSLALREKVKQTEADLHETERIYKRIVEQATDLIYILDLEMRVVLLNRHALETFSVLVRTESEGGVITDEADLLNPDMYVGRRLDELFGPQDANFMRRQIDRLLDQKASQSYEHTIRVKGRKLHLSTKLIAIRDDKREIRNVLGISRDLTEKMEMEQRIYNTEKLASIGTLAAGVAHEINNPLGVILGFTDLLLERFEEGSSEKEDLNIIEFNANHAKKVVEDLLGFARITEGLEHNVDVKQSIETVVTITRNTLMTKKIDLQVALPDSLPRVKGDTREYQQVIFNLINNAVAAMGGQGGSIVIKGEADDDWVRISVTDSGPGISDKIKPRIFDPFFTTKKVGEGTGLGLSLCYGIVNKYGGKIIFSSLSKEDNPNLPSYTTFTVSMPVYRADEAPEGGDR